MADLDTIVAACGVLIDTAAGGFRHYGTAWSVGPGEWVTVWSEAEVPGSDVRLLVTQTGEVAPLAGWEQEEDSAIAGFRSATAKDSLPVAAEGSLSKRLPLAAVGFPSVIDHPTFQLHRPSLDPELYLPYLCPWQERGHLALFTVAEGFLTGRWYNGMQGGPVLTEAGAVVGVVLDGAIEPEALPLTRFHRLV